MYVYMYLTPLPIFINTRFCSYQLYPSSNSASYMCLVSVLQKRKINTGNKISKSCYSFADVQT